MTRLIKKYKNRRLYDTTRSQYITIEEVECYVVEGVSFRVEDSTNGKDITSETLLQIIVEMESGASQFLSPEILRQIIILAHHPLNQSFKSMLEQMFAGMEKAVETNPYLEDYKKATAQMQQLMQNWQTLFK